MQLEFLYVDFVSWASLVVQIVKSLPAMWEAQFRSLGQEYTLEKEVPIHSSILDWRISRTQVSVRLQSWDRKESNTTEQLSLALLYPETLTKSLISCRSLFLYFCCPLAFSMSTVVSLANRDSFISSFLIDMLFNVGILALFLITGGKHSAFHHQVWC